MRLERGVLFISQDEMKDLTTNLDNKVVKALQIKVDSYQTEVSELKEILEKKDEEIANIAKYKDAMSSELEETKSNLEDKTNKLEKIDSEVYDLKKTVTIKENEKNKLCAELDELKQKIEELSNEFAKKENIITELSEELTKKENKITELSEELTNKENKIAELNDTLAEKIKSIEEQKDKLEKAETELSAIKPPEPTEYTSEERLVCPKCGAKGKDLKVEEDKSKVLGYIGHSPLYAKKNVCKKCGEKF
ncbi:MAG: hypothetical protein HWN80_16500 [Candidatus Lokiarchaeota archaeon]|nr:hypothetical protein [Candidatus Lokiarchaeota archaeon]